MPLLTVRAIEAHKPRPQPYKVTLDRGLQMRIAPDGARTLLVRYTVKGQDGEPQRSQVAAVTAGSGDREGVLHGQEARGSVVCDHRRAQDADADQR